MTSGRGRIRPPGATLDAPEPTPESLGHRRELPEGSIVVGHGPDFRGTAAEMIAARKH